MERAIHCRRSEQLWCCKPEEESDLGCDQAPLSVAGPGAICWPKHVEETLCSLEMLERDGIGHAVPLIALSLSDQHALLCLLVEWRNN